MNSIKLGQSDLSGSQLSLGCMRMATLEPSEAARAIAGALENGINFFEHADIYGSGASEEVFTKALAEIKTDPTNIILQSKCGIRPGFFDFSKEHILSSVDGILERLNIQQLDVLLLHRPDALMEPEEVASAFSELKNSGKVNHFGVSNQNSGQMSLLQKFLDVPIVANQLQLSIAHSPMIDHGFNVNMATDPGIDRDNGTLDFCRLHDITIQPWSPLQTGFFGGVFLDHPEYKDLNVVLNRLGEKYGVSSSAIAIAWLLRHPAKMQPILGSMNPGRIKNLCEATDVELTRQEWYELYRSTGKTIP